MLMLPLIVIAISTCVAAIKLSGTSKDIRKLAEELRKAAEELRLIKSNLFFDLEKRYPELQDNPQESATTE